MWVRLHLKRSAGPRARQLTRPHRNPFADASCTSVDAPAGGCMEGELRMAPGTAARPAPGEAVFEAAVARFDFALTDYIYG